MPFGQAILSGLRAGRARRGATPQTGLSATARALQQQHFARQRRTTSPPSSRKTSRGSAILRGLQSIRRMSSGR